MNILFAAARPLQFVRSNFMSQSKFAPLAKVCYNLTLTCGVKTKQAAAKRIIRTKSGKLKHAHSGA